MTRPPPATGHATVILADVNQTNGTRERIFQTLYFRVVYVYANLVPVKTRRIGECLLLLTALGFLSLLSYAHLAFTHSSPNCLEHVRPIWPRNGILHVQVASGIGSFVSQLHTAAAEAVRSKGVSGQSTNLLVDSFGLADQPVCIAQSYDTVSNQDPVHNYVAYNRKLFYKTCEGCAEDEPMLDVSDGLAGGEQCAVEYSLEYGLLRLSEATRQRLRIPILYVSLDPDREVCFGKSFNRLLTEYIFGYDLVVMSSIKSLANDYDVKGYMRNLVTGEQYRFMSVWTSRTAYISAFFIMIGFTFSISAVLRFSNRHIFMLILHLFHVLELNGIVTPPLTDLIWLILGLVGMEAVMAEFFSDANIAFFVILLVWMADQYNSICCNTVIGRLLWLRFFYLYHYIFYAYYYRFSGQFSYLALLTCWTLTLHIMVYFFHHYELPLVVRRLQLQNVVSRLETSHHHIHVRVRMEQMTANNNNNNNNNNNVQTPDTGQQPADAVPTMNNDNGTPAPTEEELNDVLRRVISRVDEL